MARLSGKKKELLIDYKKSWASDFDRKFSEASLLNSIVDFQLKSQIDKWSKQSFNT